METNGKGNSEKFLSLLRRYNSILSRAMLYNVSFMKKYFESDRALMYAFMKSTIQSTNTQTKHRVVKGQRHVTCRKKELLKAPLVYKAWCTGRQRKTWRNQPICARVASLYYMACVCNWYNSPILPRPCHIDLAITQWIRQGLFLRLAVKSSLSDDKWLLIL